MYKLTLEEAIKLSIEKWQLIVENDGEELDWFDEYHQKFNKFKYQCPLCELFIPGSKEYENCGDCPLNLHDDLGGENSCSQWDHPWGIWSENETIETAQIVLDLIKERTNEQT